VKCNICKITLAVPTAGKAKINGEIVAVME